MPNHQDLIEKSRELIDEHNRFGLSYSCGIAHEGFNLVPELSQALSDVIKENERYQIRLDSEHDYLRKEMHEARQHLINAQHFMRTINCSSLEEASRVAHYLKSLDLIK